MSERYSCEKAFCATSFLIASGAYVRLLHGFFGVATVNLFLLVTQLMIKSLDGYFSATVLSD